MPNAKSGAAFPDVPMIDLCPPVVVWWEQASGAVLREMCGAAQSAMNRGRKLFRRAMHGTKGQSALEWPA